LPKSAIRNQGVPAGMPHIAVTGSPSGTVWPECSFSATG
jgi:hypothetical protein